MAEYYEKSTIITFLRYGVPSNCMMTPNHIERMLGCIPAVDAKPVVHGQWISECEPHYECSACHHWYHLYAHANYCPNCGAKMDKEDR